MQHKLKNSKLKYLFTSFIILLMLSACGTRKTSIIWVNSTKSKCDFGAGTTECLSISRTKTIETPNWELFYSYIEGFEFEPGYFQKIEIQKVRIDNSRLPSDANSIKYKVVEVLEKKRDKKLILHDIWAVKQINGVAFNKKSERPNLEINLKKMRIFGTNGCNNYNGSIASLTNSQISFSEISSTRKLCPDMSISKAYDKALIASIRYKLDKTLLIFFDENDNETLRFIKVD